MQGNSLSARLHVFGSFAKPPQEVLSIISLLGVYKMTWEALDFQQTCDFQSNETYSNYYQKLHQIQLINTDG